MEMDIVDGQIGNIGAYDVEFKAGKLVAKVNASAGGVADVALVVTVGAEQVIEALKKAIPGTIDDAILEIAKQALLK